MNIAAELRTLNLPVGSFIVVGSGIMSVLGLRESSDIDLLVTPKLYKQLDEAGWEHSVGTHQEGLKNGVFDVGTLWDGKTIDEMKDKVTYIDDVPYLSLAELRIWKQNLGREKDLRDIALIDTYLRSKS